MAKTRRLRGSRRANNNAPRTPNRRPQFIEPPPVRRVRANGVVAAAVQGLGPIPQVPRFNRNFLNPGPPGNSPGRNPHIRGRRLTCRRR